MHGRQSIGQSFFPRAQARQEKAQHSARKSVQWYFSTSPCLEHSMCVHVRQAVG